MKNCVLTMPKIDFLIFIICFSCFAENRTDYIGISKNKLESLFKEKSLVSGAYAMLRIFKEEKNLEVWLQKENTMQLLKNYPICALSGELGPKEKEGDKQTPEGIYYITQESFNPNSKYHLSIDIGYPNSYDKYLNRTGGSIVIHGYCASIGCFAIGNEAIEEVYGLLLNSIKNGQKTIQVHVFPFQMSPETINAHMGIPEDREWIKLSRLINSKGKSCREKTFKYDEFYDFWSNLLPVYEYFEKNRRIPVVKTNYNGYINAEYK